MSGLSMIASACAALDLDPLEHGLQLVDARAFTVSADQSSSTSPSWATVQGLNAYAPPLLPFPVVPTQPALICRLSNNEIVTNLKQSLMQRYPAEHPVRLVRVDGVAEMSHTWDIHLFDLDRQKLDDHSCAYLSPLTSLNDTRGPDGPAYVVARLLGPGGCPWDGEQTHRSLRSALLEEVHEVLEAIDADDTSALTEELGDLLLAVLMHSEMARQAGVFDLGDVYGHLAAKLIRRHPHVFGELHVTDSGEVLRNWDAIKQHERAVKGRQPRSTLDGIPPTLPALPTAQELTHKATKVGFRWPDIQGAWNKVHEEIAELQEAAKIQDPLEHDGKRRIEEEFGDVLFALAGLARWLEVDAESALRGANAKFRQRFASIEQQAQAQGRDPTSMSTDEKRSLWSQAKLIRDT